MNDRHISTWYGATTTEQLRGIEHPTFDDLDPNPHYQRRIVALLEKYGSVSTLFKQSKFESNGMPKVTDVDMFLISDVHVQNLTPALNTGEISAGSYLQIGKTLGKNEEVDERDKRNSRRPLLTICMIGENSPIKTLEGYQSRSRLFTKEPINLTPYRTIDENDLTPETDQRYHLETILHGFMQNVVLERKEHNWYDVVTWKP